jgi:hypothetical protein
MFLPEGFDLGGGGRLPGLMGLRVGGSDNEETSKDNSGAGASNNDPDAPAFSTRIAWRENGDGDVFAQIPKTPLGRALHNGRRVFQIPRGRWVQFEQEVVLNDTDMRNGIVRVWIDGALRFENTNVVFRENDTAKVTGVLAEVVPMGRDVPANAKDQKLMITPFEIRWQKQ